MNLVQDLQGAPSADNQGYLTGQFQGAGTANASSEAGPAVATAELGAGLDQAENVFQTGKFD